MGLILECYAIPVDASSDDEMRVPGRLIGSASINSAAAEALLAPLVDGPLAGLDLAAQGATGIRFHLHELPGLKASLSTAGVDADIANVIADAIDEAMDRQSSLWIGLA
jgi:hypothetical protein